MSLLGAHPQPAHPGHQAMQKQPLAGRGCYPAAPIKKKPGVVPHPHHKGAYGGYARQQLPVAQPVASPLLPTVAEMPFNLKERRLVEHRVRNPHRRFQPKDLQKVVAHWLRVPEGEQLWKKGGGHVVVNERSGGIIPYEHKVTKNVAQLQKHINVRALIVPELSKEEALNIARRISVVACQGKGLVSAYGGLVSPQPNHTDADLTSELSKIVKAQSGADLSAFSWVKVLEIHYSDSPKTIFFAPRLRETPTPVFSPQTTPAEPNSTTQEDNIIVAPQRFTLATLHEYQVNSNTPRDALELLMAVDAMDEWGKRDMANVILKTLRTRGEESRIKSGLESAWHEKQSAKKRKRDEACEQKKTRRLDRDQNMKKEWIEEDEGKTDEEKRVAMQARQKILKEIRESDQNEDQEQEAGWNNEDSADAPPKPQTKTIKIVQQDQFEAFQYFDRSNEGSLTRARLHNILLCIEEQLTFNQIETLLTLPQLPKKQDHLPYRPLAVTTEEVPDDSAEEPPPAEATPPPAAE